MKMQTKEEILSFFLIFGVRAKIRHGWDNEFSKIEIKVPRRWLHLMRKIMLSSTTMGTFVSVLPLKFWECRLPFRNIHVDWQETRGEAPEKEWIA